MKKFLISLILIITIIPSCIYAYSSGFEYMVNAIQMKTTNINGLKLNEEIYEKYNIFVYGSPLNISTQKQKWKTTKNGNWTLNGGAWNGTGARGEYWILGEDYTGKLVHNEIYPDDYNSGTSPINWNYRKIKDALESWNDMSKYQYDLQREYMLNSKLSRFGVEYDLTVLNIGLNKARVESYATWGSAGSVYTEKPGEGNVYWVATFSVPPMAADAKLHSVIELPNGNEYKAGKDEDVIEIPLNFGAYLEGLNEYAKAEHVKIIEAELKVNGVSKNVISETKKINISKDESLTINRSDYNTKEVSIELECNAFLSTYFASDPVMYASTKEIINIKFEDEKFEMPDIRNNKEAPYIYSYSIKRVSTDDIGREKLVDLYKTRDGKRNFICAGQVIKVQVETSSDASGVYLNFAGGSSIKTLDDVTKNFEWDEPRSRKVKTRYSTLKQLNKAYSFPRNLELSRNGDKKVYTMTYVIPYGTTPSLHSWNSLREESKDAFKIDESKLFTRKSSAYTIVLTAYSEDGKRTKTYQLDVAERWDELYNRDISKYIK